MSTDKKYLNQTIGGDLRIPHNPGLDIEKNNNIGYKSVDFKNIEILQFKIILIGDQSVGKTSIMSKFIYQDFKASYQATIGVDYKTKEIYLNNNTIGASLRIFDTCGQERFRSITRNYFKNSNGVFLVFDLANKNSVKNLNIWYKDIENNVDKDCVVFVIGNKMDLKDRDYSIAQEGKQFAKEKGLNYFEVSAMTGAGVNNIFEKMTKILVNNFKKGQNQNEEAKVNNNNLNLDSYNKDRGKVEQNRNQMHCC